MAPLPQNNTQRLFIDYEGETGQHTLMVRPSSDLTFGAVVALGQTLVNLFAPIWSSDVDISGYRYSGPGQAFSIDLTPPTLTPTGGAFGGGNLNPRFVSFIARSSGGRRSRLYLYNCNFTSVNDYRINPGDDAEVEAVRDGLAALGTDLVGIDDNPLTWKDYANWGFNSYYQRKARVEA